LDKPIPEKDTRGESGAENGGRSATVQTIPPRILRKKAILRKARGKKVKLRRASGVSMGGTENNSK